MSDALPPPTAGATAPVRLLVSGDLHLGRAPSRVPAGDRSLSVEAVVRALVDRAIEQRPDAVVLTGDLADADNKLFEAYGILERQLRRLAAAEIPVVMVAGNHDHDVAARLADALSDEVGGAAGSGAPITLLGRGQTWETMTLRRDGRDVLRLAGWSFAGPHHTESPLAGFPSLPGDVPTVGVLHADLDASASDYAPVGLAELRSKPVAVWLLGHIHKPVLLDATSDSGGGAPVLYPGSPQPLSPKERGRHGAWMVEVSPGRVAARMVPLATIRYDRLAADLTDAADRPEMRARVLDAVREHAAAARAEAPGLRHLCLRLTLDGRTPAFAEAEALAAELRAETSLSAGGLGVTLDGVLSAVRPARDLARLAAGSGPVASLAGLAQRLDAAETPDALAPADRRLLATATEGVRTARRARPFGALLDAERLAGDAEAEALRRLRHQTFRLLDATLAQTT